MPLRIQLCSDLHLERYPDYLPQPAPGADVLVLAGDIGSYQLNSRLREADFGLSRFSPLRPDAPWPRVLFVPGNHEFDALEFDQTSTRLRRLCEELGIEWLDRQVRVIEGVRFVGSTLWADFEALAQREPTETRRLQALEKAFRAADFYLKKNTTLRDGRPVLARELRELALDSQAWLREALSASFDGPTVVVTHFAPTLHSIDPRYGLTPGSAGFTNALDELLPLADVWMHGHLHCPQDLRVPTARGHCRIVANPRGYFSKGEQGHFREAFVVEVAAQPADRPALSGLQA